MNHHESSLSEFSQTQTMKRFGKHLRADLKRFITEKKSENPNWDPSDWKIGAINLKVPIPNLSITNRNTDKRYHLKIHGVPKNLSEPECFLLREAIYIIGAEHMFGAAKARRRLLGHDDIREVTQLKPDAWKKWVNTNYDTWLTSIEAHLSSSERKDDRIVDAEDLISLALEKTWNVYRNNPDHSSSLNRVMQKHIIQVIASYEHPATHHRSGMSFDRESDRSLVDKNIGNASWRNFVDRQRDGTLPAMFMNSISTLIDKVQSKLTEDQKDYLYAILDIHHKIQSDPQYIPSHKAIVAAAYPDVAGIHRQSVSATLGVLRRKIQKTAEELAPGNPEMMEASAYINHLMARGVIHRSQEPRSK